ncbi:hypothetical protein [uncultured Trichococcus sp.]|uniref:hypothetical protein n=1 Tax=uncultured Trichococcus sp. TaxID=189665 RepID=UPI002A1892A1|nr:hypothetical protein [uncultured Trichococcus sp.]
MKKKLVLFVGVVIIIALGMVGAKWYISNQAGIPQIDILKLDKNENIESSKDDLTQENKLIHYSVDDIFKSFLNLSNNDYDSIFEEEHLSFLKKLHDKYGINVSGYVFFEDGEYNLTDIPNDYALEFQENSDWLKFGFHSLNAETNYENENTQKAKEDYEKVIKELTRITGGESAIDTTVRLHYYAASDEAIEGFQTAELGIERLLSPEDQRLAYNLDEEETSYLYQYDYFNLNGLEYIKTDVRMENLDNPEDYYDSFIQQEELNGILAVFTHEPFLIDSEIQNKTYQLLDLFETYIPAGF